MWFTDLWNYSIIPYLLEAVREGLQVRRMLLLVSSDLSARAGDPVLPPVWHRMETAAGHKTWLSSLIVG